MSEALATLDPAAPEPLAAARAALQRHDWQVAYDLFNAADAAAAPAGLSGPDLASLADAAFFSAKPDALITARERASQAFQAAGDPVQAAIQALEVAREQGFRGNASIAGAWLRRAEKLVAGLPEGVAHGDLALAKSFAAQGEGDFDAAFRFSEEAARIARDAGNADLEAMANVNLGSLKVKMGQLKDGFTLLEEATFAAVNGDLSPYSTGVSYCAMIRACRDVTDYKRASEWTEQTERWCQRESVSGFPGVCRVHRAEIVAKTGSLERAEAELERANEELAAYKATLVMGDGYYALGETRLRRGDLAGAEAALNQASELGHSPQPSLALVRLAQGKIRAALTAINGAAADDAGWDRLAKTHVLPAQVEIALAAGELPIAKRAVEQLATVVETFDAPVNQASLAEARGRVLLAEGDAAGAARELRAAIKTWREVVSPFEVARDRGLLAQALLALGDDEAAELELQASYKEFDRLGATLEAAAIQQLLDAAAERKAAPVQARMTFMFTDIVGSTLLAEELGNAAWAQLLRWHDDTLRALIARHAGRVVNQTGDGFFAAFADAQAAINAAIDIQRALADQRRLNGSRLSIRIGIHTADANRRGDDYSGVGVHVAARVSALAEADEIVVSRGTLDEVGSAQSTNPRSATLKGVAAPVEVASLTWS